ncbi:MAG: peptide-methionine (S)-S-oxide reductase [Bacteroidetes bacterium 47-18]|nr:MAG: peptide-methionine (S)-S-oxide reductase [Bacteroidetes bacterium 47-18]
MTPTDSQHTGSEVAVFGAGCFWCVEASFMDLKGVDSVKSGYTGGTTANPTYKEVCTGHTGHAEVLYIIYRPEIISYDKLLEVFFMVHDPTQLNRQGNDIGTQYRSEVFYTTPEQKDQAEKAIKALEQAGVYDRPIVTRISPLTVFYPAEAYHDNYFNLHPEEGYCQVVVRPKMEKIRKAFADYMK